MPWPWSSVLGFRNKKIIEAYRCLQQEYGAETVIITCGESDKDHIQKELATGRVHTLLDIREFFSRRQHWDLAGNQLRHKTSFSSDSVYGDFKKRELNAAAAAIMKNVHETGPNSFHIVFCRSGLHRAQAAARHTGELLAQQGSSVGVINASSLSRWWVPDDCNLLVLWPEKRPRGFRTVLLICHPAAIRKTPHQPLALRYIWIPL